MKVNKVNKVAKVTKAIKEMEVNAEEVNAEEVKAPIKLEVDMEALQVLNGFLTSTSENAKYGTVDYAAAYNVAVGLFTKVIKQA